MAEKESGAAKAVGDTATEQDEPRDPARIEAEIEATREQLGDTVAALADKTDVKKQAKRRVEETKSAAQEKATDTANAAKDSLHDAPEGARQARDQTLAAIRENPAAAAAGATIALLAIALLVRRSRR